MYTTNIYSTIASTEPPIHEAEAVAHSDIMQQLLHSNVFNFLIVLAILIYLIKKFNLVSAITNKTYAIRNRIKDAEDEKQRSEKELETSKKVHSLIPHETEKILNEASKIADSLKKRIEEETLLSEQELNKKAEKSIKIEIETASSEVKKDVAKAAFLIAEEHIKQSLNDKMHKKFIDEFINSLDELKVT